MTNKLEEKDFQEIIQAVALGIFRPQLAAGIQEDGAIVFNLVLAPQFSLQLAVTGAQVKDIVAQMSEDQWKDVVSARLSNAKNQLAIVRSMKDVRRAD